MMLKAYVRIWLVVSVLMLYEAWALNSAPQASLLAKLAGAGFLPHELDLNPAPGKRISLWLGWMGIGVMLLTNLYVFRRRWSVMRQIGKISNWLDFHIFCGLLGPTFIVFHTNFHVRGLVAVSFWSMMVSFASGIVGRYFYIQLLGQKADIDRSLAVWDEKIRAIGLSQTTLAEARDATLAVAGVNPAGATATVSQSVLNSLKGDLKLTFGRLSLPDGISADGRYALIQYAVLRRRALYLEQFRRLMGYWHTFHMPFAVFMYVVAVVHIATALLLQTSS